jgi:hypothetical protein
MAESLNPPPFRHSDNFLNDEEDDNEDNDDLFVSTVEVSLHLVHNFKRFDCFFLNYLMTKKCFICLNLINK